jgi:hypothetical protein
VRLDKVENRVDDVLTGTFTVETDQVNLYGPIRELGHEHPSAFFSFVV